MEENLQTGQVILEESLLNTLINDGEFFGATAPYLKKEYFADIGNSMIFEKIQEFQSQFNAKPSMKDIIVLLKDIPKERREIVTEAIKKVAYSSETLHPSLLISSTEAFIKNAIRTQGLILGAEGMQTNNESKKLRSLEILKEAEAVSLNVELGMMDSDIDARIEYYQDTTERLLTGIPSFDSRLGKGFYKKSLTVINAPQGVGKSATLSDWAVRFQKQGRDVVVISLEMRPEEWYQRVDANTCNIPIWQLATIDPQVIRNNKQKYDQTPTEDGKKIGRMVIQEYPGYSLSANMLNAYLNKLEQAGRVKDPVLIVDYLGIMRANSPTGSKYDDFANIAVELRAIAQLRNIECFTAAQMNRSSFGNLEASNEAVADSIGIGNAADAMIMVNQTAEMKELGEVQVTYAKNRFGGRTDTFKMGFDYEFFRYEDRFYGGSQKPTSNIENQLKIEEDLFKNM